jgi:hypothetical protein
LKPYMTFFSKLLGDSIRRDKRRPFSWRGSKTRCGDAVRISELNPALTIALALDLTIF